MKRDAVIAIAIIVAVLGIAYGVSAMRVPVPMRPTHPFTTQSPTATIPAAAPGQPPIGRVIMRVNGEPITESEFSASFASMPDEMKQQFNSEQGKQAFAEQLVRMKLLEQEARKRHLDNDPRVAAQLAANRTDILASAAAAKLVETASPQAVQKFYKENQQKLQTVDLSHVVIAYQGGMAQPRKGGAAPDERTAMNKALQIYQRLQEGAKFEEVAAKESDDGQTAARGGAIGAVGPGMLPPELEAKVMQMKEGQISGPIPSRYGIHIFKVGPRRTRALGEVQERIAQKVKQDETMARIEELRKAAKVDYDPKFFPDAKNWQNNRPPQQPARPPA